jgi:Spy/CpxP family protein refolding chaperone
MGFEPLVFSAGSEVRADDLELTPDQDQTLKTLNQQFHREQAQIRKKIMIRRMELRTLNAEEIRAEKGEEIRREIQTLLLQGRERALFYRQEATQVLSPEQRKKISAETDLGFHCGGWFHRGGRWGIGTGSGGPGSSR